MLSLTLLREHVDEIIEYTKQCAPNEACGFILGKNNTSKTVIPIQNIASNPLVAFQFDAQAQIDAMLKAHHQNLDIVAIYHSHPTTDAIPSETDIREASYPDIPYLIISLKHSKPKLQAWKIQSREVYPIKIMVTHSPHAITPPSSNTTLTRPQKIALLVSILLSVILFVSYSIYLLPPAPPIPTAGG